MTKALPSVKVKHFAAMLGLSRPWGGVLNYTRLAWPASGMLEGLSYYGLTLYGSYVHVPVSSVLPISHNYIAPQCSPYNGCAFTLHPQSLPLPQLRCASPFFICYTLLTLLAWYCNICKYRNVQTRESTGWYYEIFSEWKFAYRHLHKLFCIFTWFSTKNGIKKGLLIGIDW